ncbi:hypothetical protein HYH02_014578 [Chlamydomonas schloesseri]|uniref:Uncharacterized protein n=1 Tax=Chlamydomonas schloesseri TaxID=2026947 RepID=A0A835SM42_9CHLO|nr:hypothetical protein HYH02_014578 [Chlamydomonas schloesseri]|eukprot:KAG2427532.1 hypothetical protein HYH02_014578 [Chlamydomonas schloesseri]
MGTCNTACPYPGGRPGAAAGGGGHAEPLGVQVDTDVATMVSPLRRDSRLAAVPLDARVAMLLRESKLEVMAMGLFADDAPNGLRTRGSSGGASSAVAAAGELEEVFGAEAGGGPRGRWVFESDQEVEANLVGYAGARAAVQEVAANMAAAYGVEAREWSVGYPCIEYVDAGPGQRGVAEQAPRTVLPAGRRGFAVLVPAEADGASLNVVCGSHNDITAFQARVGMYEAAVAVGAAPPGAAAGVRASGMEPGAQHGAASAAAAASIPLHVMKRIRMLPQHALLVDGQLIVASVAGPDGGRGGRQLWMRMVAGPLSDTEREKLSWDNFVAAVDSRFACRVL